MSHCRLLFEAKAPAERFSDPVCIARMYGIATTQMYMFRRCNVNAKWIRTTAIPHFAMILVPSLSQPHRGVGQKAPQLPMRLPNTGRDIQDLFFRLPV